MSMVTREEHTGVLLAALDTTMLATITASICTSFNSFGYLSWIVTTYAFGACIPHPLSGHLTDIYGRRAGLALYYTVFATGTVLCGRSLIFK
ncbi:hypothetical protein B0H66DRAFT_542411 [Apodospora peruviana]|uniref:Major facilitator superfamily (MFS) profile domain-containing protein n=1 Tax=Apodospora peruviana TaxID=516989 RepID=A0AAE0MET5_9PEZI|nr:hypothetical protein B0H66DRAFT_542411 [Apodospora peruviana]